MAHGESGVVCHVCQRCARKNGAAQRKNRFVNAFCWVFSVDVCHLIRENHFQNTTGKMRYILLLSANITRCSCDSSRKKFADWPLKMARPAPALHQIPTHLHKSAGRQPLRWWRRAGAGGFGGGGGGDFSAPACGEKIYNTVTFD